MWAASSEAAAADELQQALAPTRAEDWLPAVRHVDAQGTVTTGTSVACQDVVQPTGTDDAGMLEIVTLDTHDDDAMPEATTALLTDARTITATANQLVVATPMWPQLDQPAAGGAVPAPAPAMDVVAPDAGRTRLHLFDLGPDGTTHRASGEVPGMLLNQFSLSLDGDLLRAATTVGKPVRGWQRVGRQRAAPAGRPSRGRRQRRRPGSGRDASTRCASWVTAPTWSPSARPTRCTRSTCPTRRRRAWPAS